MMDRVPFPGARGWAPGYREVGLRVPLRTVSLAALLLAMLLPRPELFPAAAQADDSNPMPDLRWDEADARRVVAAAAAYIVCHERTHRPWLISIRALLR